MSLTLPADVEEKVHAKVAAGPYESPGELILDALSALDEREQSRKEYGEWLRREVQVGLDQLDRGEGLDGEAVFEEIRRKSQEKRTQVVR